MLLHLSDVLGREVAVLFRGEATAGREWSATLDAAALPAGTYVVRLEHPAGTARLTVTC